MSAARREFRSCPQVIDSLGAWQSGALGQDPEAEARLEAHLERCDDCRKLATAYKGVPERLRVALAPDLPTPRTLERIARIARVGETPVGEQLYHGGARIDDDVPAGTGKQRRVHVRSALWGALGALLFVATVTLGVLAITTERSDEVVSSILENHAAGVERLDLGLAATSDTEAIRNLLPGAAEGLVDGGLSLRHVEEVRVAGAHAMMMAYTGQSDVITMHIVPSRTDAALIGGEPLEAQGVTYRVSHISGTSLVAWREESRIKVLASAMSNGDLFAIARRLVMDQDSAR